MNTSVASAPDRLPLERRVRVRTEQDERPAETRPVSLYDGVHAWVLIGDPGAGKSDVLQERSDAENGHYISARDFVELGPGVGWHEPLFIDGLDEISSGAAQGDTALGRIRAKLQALGVPRFRISCREADWRGSADSAALQRLVSPRDFLELHLEPLSREEARTLVAFWHGTDAEQAEAFLREAERRGLDGLLDNPQNLRMLVKATASGWPASRLQTYAQACAELVKEESPEHRAAYHEAPRPHAELLRAAEYLCAVLLLSGKAFWALQRADNTPADSFALNDLPTGLPGTPLWASCRAVLGTRLFRGAGGLFYPVHRTVAEYLGARYLVGRLDAGLPTGRLLALMLGEDGGTVPELRGLHAWLTAVATGDLRAELITHDPLGVVLYGDVHDFTRSEKLRVLDALSQEARRYTFFRSQDWSSEPFGALATADMEGDFRALLTSPDRSPAHLALVDCVLDALAHGYCSSKLKPELDRVIRDAGYWSGSRTEALGVLLRLEQAERHWSLSLQLLEDIDTNKVQDSEDELLGTLLRHLYPGQISPSQIWSYLRNPRSDTLFGSYARFWRDLGDKGASSKDVPVLLDALATSGYQLPNRHDHLRSAELVGSLLVRGIAHWGLELDIPHLYRWLALGLGPHSHCPLEREHQESLRLWLKEHPDRYKALFEHGIQLDLRDDKPSGNLWRILQHLFHSPEPDDAHVWLLAVAENAPQEEWRHQLLALAFRIAENRLGSNSALELLEVWLATHPQDNTWVNEFLRCPYPPNAQDQEHIDWELRHKRELDAEKREKIEFFRKALPTFNTETPHLGALMEVANHYLNFFRDGNGSTPGERLLNLLNRNHEWVKLALHGLRRCLFRTDLPSAIEIIDLHAKGRRYSIATPCLAAMALRQEEDPSTAVELPDPQLEGMVAFRLANDYDNPPDWFQHLLATRPEILAGVMLPFIRTQLTARKEHISGLYALAHNSEYAAVAKRIVPELLHGFPAKAHKKLLESLRLLIIAALTQLDRTVALEIVARKLAGRALDAAQHVYWLGAGLQLAPEVYLEPARRYISQTQARSSHLVNLLLDQRQESSHRVVWSLPALEFLVTLLGSRSNPRQWRGGAGLVTPAMHLGEYVEGLINTLAGMPDDDATQSFPRLLADSKLAPWADTLRRAAFDQQITRRKARFQPASVPKVCQTLANLKPASAADLWALTQDHLRQLIRRIRDENTNDYRQYWDLTASKPRLEEECRNALLSDLKLRLEPLPITAEPEGRYVDDKRADIKVSAEGYTIPVEIKCEWNTDLWKAIEAQLIAKYTRDPACGGFGIYLVFWFGGSRQKATPLDGLARPKTPVELQQRLAASIPVQHRHKIAILVVDCSLPPPGKK